MREAGTLLLGELLACHPYLLGWEQGSLLSSLSWAILSHAQAPEQCPTSLALSVSFCSS